MKYIITESRLDNLIFKFLDTKLNGTKMFKGAYYDITLGFNGPTHGLIAWDAPGRLFISTNLSGSVEDLFGIEELEAFKIIGRYFEDRYDLEVIHYSPLY